MFTAIVLDDDSQAFLKKQFATMRELTRTPDVLCHHVTLALGDKSNVYLVGEGRTMRITHIGWIMGMVLAARVSNCCDSANEFAHVTIAINSANLGKPRMSNDITQWTEIGTDVPLCLHGTVQVVE